MKYSIKKISFLMIIFTLILSISSCFKEQNDLDKVNNVLGLINDIPNIEDITLADEDYIVYSRRVYETLKDSEKELISNIDKLVKAEDRIKLLKDGEEENSDISYIIEAINSLPNASQITLENGTAIKEIREKYDALSELGKGKITNYFRFELVEGIYNELVEDEINNRTSNEVIELIKNLPDQEKITLEDEENILKVREQYNALSDRAKYLVTNYDKLEALEVVIKALKDDASYDVREVLECISDVATTSTNEKLILSNEYVDVEWTSSNPKLYYFSDGYARVSILHQTHRKQNVEVTAKITRKNGTVIELSKLITVNPVEFTKMPSTPVATYFAVGAVNSYKKNSLRYAQEKTLFSENARKTLDILYYAFATIDAEGRCTLANEDILPEIMDLKKDNVRIVLCINGVSTQASKAFKTITSDDNLRAKFIDNMMNLVEKYNFDGIDIDWESTSECKVVASNMNVLMKELREEMTERQDPGGTPYFLSAAVPGTSWGVTGDSGSKRFDLATLNQYVDYINMMSYDLNNTTKTTHLSSLYSSSNDGGYGFGCFYGTNLFTREGLSKEKIIIGSAGYGKAYRVTGTSTNSNYPGLGVSGSLIKIDYVSSGSFASGTLYGNAIIELLNSGNFVEYKEYNNSGKLVGSYLYDSKNEVFVTYDSKDVFAAKYQYAASTKGMGIMCWSYTEDTADNYINAIYECKK